MFHHDCMAREENALPPKRQAFLEALGSSLCNAPRRAGHDRGAFVDEAIIPSAYGEAAEILRNFQESRTH